MPADINFLSSNGDQEEPKKEPQVRKVVYTTPADDVKSKKTIEHGGVLSIFSRSKKSEIPVPPAPGPEPKISGPKKVDKPRISKTEITYEKPKKEPKPDKPNKLVLWLSSLFSRKGPQVTSGAPKEKVPTEKKPSEIAEKHEEISTQFKKVGDTLPEAPMPPAPPRFDQFANTPIPPPPAPVVEKIVPPQARVTADMEKQKVPQKTTAAMPAFTQGQQDTGPFVQGLTFDVNLVPDELLQRKRTLNRLTLLGLVIVISIAVVGVGFGVLSFYRENVVSQSRDLTDQLAAVKNQIQRLEPIQLDAIVLEQRTKEVNNILSTHVYWTKFFSSLETYTLAGVQVVNVSADANGSVTIEARAEKPEAAFEQLRVLQAAKDFVSTASLVSLPSIPEEPRETDDTTTGPGGIPSELLPGTQTYSSFSIQMVLTPSLLYRGNVLTL